MANIDWQIERKKVNERGRHLLETGKWSDCSFVVGTDPHQQIFRVHKLFLAMSSPVFEAMFFGRMPERNDPIPILDVQPDAFKALLHYLYTDEINFQSFDQACELCYVAKKYMIPHLVEACTKYLWEDLYPKNACRAYEFAKLFEEPSLMKKCLQIISCETQAVLQAQSFEDIELSTLLTILDQDELNISSELDLFEAVSQWALCECSRKGLSTDDEKSLRSVVGTALGKIRFLTLSPAQFAEGPALSPLLTKDESFALLMHISSKTVSKLSLPDGFSECARPRKRPFKFISSQDFKYPSTDHQDFKFPSSDETYTRTKQALSVTSSEHDDVAKLSSSSGESSREGHKLYCMRHVVHQPHILNADILDCSVSFTVDRNICVLGIQVPTQVYPRSSITNNLAQSSQSPETYTEVLYAHLLDAESSRLTYTHFTCKVKYDSMVEITFNRPVYIQRSKVYKVGVVLNKGGWYPMGACSSQVINDGIVFYFGEGCDSVRDGLIRTIVYSF